MEDLLLLHCSASYAPLSPMNFLKQAAKVCGDKVSIVYGTVGFSWRETHDRCLRIASALSQLGISSGDTVAALAPNIPALYELHFAVPMAGAVLSALNIRLDTATLAVILEKLEAKFIFIDNQYVHVVHEALEILSQKKGKQPFVVLIQEDDQATTLVANYEFASGSMKYNDLLGMGGTDFEIVKPKDDGDPISVNFTSGSTGEPKGVLYSHRAAYLNSLASVIRYDMRIAPVFLWTVDMFRCNGWCCTWAMAALGGTSICLRNVSAKVIFDSIHLHTVTHLCGAPAILNMIADAPACEQRPLPCKVHVIIAGVLSMSQVLKVEGLGFTVSYAYGMTEVLGPAIVRPWRADWNSRFSNEHKNDQFQVGLDNLVIEEVDVKEADSMKSVPRDGKTIGEIMFRGNTLMSGYLKNPKATQEAFKDGWYRTRDLGLMHPNGVIQLKDRAMDIIVSGGEIISTLEVEAVLLSHPKVLEAAVVGKHDDCLKEKPCAFVKLKEGYDASSVEIVKFCEEQLPDFMVPRIVVFGELPVNSTGKVQKFSLRLKANAIHNNRISPKNGCQRS
ncbi:probable acyl-activating enzyme 1, peroxisomal [Durio zibethinus]|uniref:Probable acyl-activating enzyme 1, peroxisomal n=1 Tax=Durio zibethinus TaxID=66656 RepID=A0A6P5ZGA4_DURZI|nr:probable acyl-activating enzyme 1, peroxisomal [Durio zibethinus]XP_022751525.1 probable acyl-activating enzyme 1, peroxisomal [Durio zibethinus]